MVFNLSIEKVNAMTNEVLSTDTLVTDRWSDVQEYWNDNGVNKYEDIENLVRDLRKSGNYNLYCNTELMCGDGIILNINANKKDK